MADKRRSGAPLAKRSDGEAGFRVEKLGLGHVHFEAEGRADRAGILWPDPGDQFLAADLEDDHRVGPGGFDHVDRAFEYKTLCPR